MNVCARITHCTPLGGGQLDLGLHVDTDAGDSFETNALVAFGASAATINNAVDEAVRAAVASWRGEPMAPQDGVRVFGGAVN